MNTPASTPVRIVRFQVSEPDIRRRAEIAAVCDELERRALEATLTKPAATVAK